MGILFGLAQAPAYFQRLINEVLTPFDFAFGYLDDILIYSPDVETQLKHLELIFQGLCEVDLNVRCNLATHCSVTPFVIQQPIWRPHLLERVYKPMHTLH